MVKQRMTVATFTVAGLIVALVATLSYSNSVPRKNQSSREHIEVAYLSYRDALVSNDDQLGRFFSRQVLEYWTSSLVTKSDASLVHNCSVTAKRMMVGNLIQDVRMYDIQVLDSTHGIITIYASEKEQGNVMSIALDYILENGKWLIGGQTINIDNEEQ